MKKMNFKFTIQPYQSEAVNSVIKVFEGQPFLNENFTYSREIKKESQEIYAEEFFTGFPNAEIKIEKSKLLENIRRVQFQNNINLSDNLSMKNNLGACSLDVEMETGTGKTYVYIKTIFELNKNYGWNKFIVVVPSIAIREGVKKSFSTMENHFMEYYGKKARYFVYDSQNLSEIDNFSSNKDISVMIINIQAFNARKDVRRIKTEIDAFGSRRPIDAIKSNRPIIILDEPQKMGGTATQESLKEFNPLFSLNYSATHKQHHNLVYVLDALDAYNKKLVKRIEVLGVDVKNLSGTSCYMYLRDILTTHDKPPMARLEFEVKHKDFIKRELRLIKAGNDLFSLSNNLEEYYGFRVSDIDPKQEILTFTNGEIIHSGEAFGDVTEKSIRTRQIRNTIISHFEKEKNLFYKGIKCLSLFFIDEVAKYRKYNDEGQEINSEYGEIFEEEYNLILEKYLDNSPYGKYLESIQTNKTHAGYFSIDKKGRKIDSSVKRGSEDSDDISAYDLILKDKERLLSFENPVRFIFSHSALREGWDNPNVFQICTLKHGGSSSTQKRQEVGRGLRLCVNQDGDRMDDLTLGEEVQNINQLTVIASDGYKNFVSNIQKSILEDLYERPAKATEEYFKGKKLLINDKEIIISDKQARDIYFYLIQNGYINTEQLIADKYRADKENNTLAELPESCKEIGGGVHKLIEGIFDPGILKEMFKNGSGSKIAEDNELNENFDKKEFQELWNLINDKYVYMVNFDGNELISKAVKNINKNMNVSRIQYTITKGIQKENLDRETLNSGEGFEISESDTNFPEYLHEIKSKYDLAGRIALITKLTRRTIIKILDGIKTEIFQKFYDNPEEFITKAAKSIKEELSTIIIEYIVYNKTEEKFDAKIFTMEKHNDYSRAYKSKKNVQNFVFTDSSVERKMAEAMDNENKVRVYAKLPRGFYIPTPVGNYSPDWAVAFEEESQKHIFFIAETKGSMDSMELNIIENSKIQCAEKLFAGLSDKNIVYRKVNDFGELLKEMK